MFDLSTSLAKKLKAATIKNEPTKAIIEKIETALCLEFQATSDYINMSNLIWEFLETDSSTTIHSFCLERGINTKTFTRNFLRYTGYAPKTLYTINRFQKAGNQLVHENPKQLFEIAYDNNFADQAHFIREFRKFSGTAPRTFQQEKITIKENAQYNYR